MKLLFKLFYIGLFTSHSICVHAGNHHDKPASFKVSEIKSGFHFLQGKGGNILVSSGSDGLLLIDSDFSDMSPALEKVLSNFDQPLQYVINTHWHGDHTQGNNMLGMKATIIAHENVYQRLSTRQEIKLFNMVSEPYPKHALPSITYEKSMILRFNDDVVNALHLPKGHTDGDSVIFFEKANVVHMGDHFFNGIFPFVDVNAEGSVRGKANNISKLLPKINADTLIVPGHGPLASKFDLIAFRDMLLGTATEVEKMILKSMDLEAIQKKGLDKKWESWTKGFLNEATWISIVYDSLIKEKKN